MLVLLLVVDVLEIYASVLDEFQEKIYDVVGAYLELFPDDLEAVLIPCLKQELFERGLRVHAWLSVLYDEMALHQNFLDNTPDIKFPFE